MNEEQVRAIFLLADFKITSIVKIANPYWPKHPDYKEVSENSPWWLVYTEQGFIEIGWRKRVISIEWANLGIVYPFNDQDGRQSLGTDKHFVTEDVTHWDTGTHAYGYGKAVQYLTALNRSLGRFNYLKQYWKDNPVNPKEFVEWEISARAAHWATNPPYEHIRVIILAKNKTDALTTFYDKYSEYRVSSCYLKSEMVKARAEAGMEEPELVG